MTTVDKLDELMEALKSLSERQTAPQRDLTEKFEKRFNKLEQ